MDTNTNVQQLKRQLNIEESYTDDDVLLQHFIDVSEVAVQNYLGVNSLTGYTATTLPITIQQAIILMASHFYLNRNMVSFAQGYEVPFSMRWLIDFYKDWTIQ